MPGGHLEVERKFDVDAPFVLPELGDLPGVGSVDEPVEHRLEATYHDSADLRLARAKVTLRRRTGGNDAGWHLKLPAAAGARREVHEPLGRAVRRPPQALLAPITGILRGAPTAPVATLRTERRATVLRAPDGRALAEIADDTVTATAHAASPDEAAEVHTWREVEAELVDGDDALLAAVTERLLAAGARPSASASKAARVLASRLGGPGAHEPGGTAGDAVVAAIRKQVEALQAADLMLRTEQPDAVHQLRVAARKLRSYLAAFRTVLAAEATEPLREELRWLGGQLAAARDDEVALEHLRAVVGGEPQDLVLGPVAARLQQTALQTERAGLDRAQDTLAGPRYLALLDGLFALCADPPLTETAAGPPRRVLRDAVRRSGRRLRRRMAAVPDDDGSARETALHEVRKAAKRVRYTARAAAPVLGRRAKDLARCARDLQATLGERQDTVVTRELCRRLGLAADAAGENAWTYGRLHALEQARAASADAAFRALAPSVHPLLRAAAKKR